MKMSIVITSIFQPTESVIAFAAKGGFEAIVVGDRKTPANWHCDKVQYLSMEEQELSRRALSKVLPYNHYCRKMLGYITAAENGADLIVDTDDDNIPKDNWTFPSFEGNFEFIPGEKGFVNIYQLYTTQPIWPRGLPLHLISTDFNLGDLLETKGCKVGIWQGLADEDPDVDAIYRLTSDTPCYFKQREPVVLGKGTISPFNSQNTLFRKELFTLLYLPTYVTFRFTDILRGLVAQPIMWLYGYHLGFTDATVVQKRNPHDYMKDFISEIPMYQHADKVVDIVSAAISGKNSIEDNLLNAYRSLLTEKIVCEKEMITLEAWLSDLANASQ